MHHNNFLFVREDFAQMSQFVLWKQKKSFFYFENYSHVPLTESQGSYARKSLEMYVIGKFEAHILIDFKTHFWNLNDFYNMRDGHFAEEVIGNNESYY